MSGSATTRPRAGADRRAACRAAAVLPAAGRPHRDRRRRAGAAEHHVSFDADGTLELVGPHRDAGAHACSRARPVDASFSEIRIDGRHLIAARRMPTSIVETLRTSDLALAWPSISKSFAATGRFVWHDEPIDATHQPDRFRRRAGRRPLRPEGSAQPARRSSSPSTATGATGRRSKIEGTLAADAASLRDTLRWAGRQAAAGGGFGRFALKAQDQRLRRHDRAVQRQCRTRRQCRRGRARLRHRRPPDPAGHARRRRARPHALRLHHPRCSPATSATGTACRSRSTA